MEWWQVIVIAVVAFAFFIAGFLFGEWLHGLGVTLGTALSTAWHNTVGSWWDRFVAWIRGLTGGTTGGTHSADAPFGRAADGYAYTSEYDCHNGRTPDGTTCLDIYYDRPA